MTPNFKELREELEEVFRYEERYRETGYIHPDVEDWEEAVWRNRFTILAALAIAERGQWVKMERFIQLHINNEISFYQSSPKKFRMRMQSGYVQPSFQVDGDSILELMSKIK